MPHVGPELPPHLAKRKRSIDDAEPPNSPPHKVQAAAAPMETLGPAMPPPRNPNEVDIDDSPEDDYGPSLQPSKPSKAPSPPPPRVLGPMPPSKNPDELDLDDSSEDDHGPAPQPNPSKPPPPKRVLGPSLPPAPLSTMPANPPDDSDDSDDEYAPALPPAAGSLAAQHLQQQQSHALSSIPEPEAPKARRAEWMLVPPSSDTSSRADPTQLKARKFASSRSAGPADKSVSAIWTETPQEKRKRLEDEVLGRVEAATSGSGARKKDGRADREDRETERRIREYNERNRGKSLYETHKDVPKEEEEDDPSKRAFDREKDMALGGRMGHGQKREMLSKAADFGSRFQQGKFL